MSRFGDFLSDTFAQAKSHEPNWIQRLPSMPGSPQSLQDAFIANRWSHPYGEQNSMDIFAGGVGHPAGSEYPWARGVGRFVGSYFLGKGLNNVTGTDWAGPAAKGIGNLFSGGGAPGGGGMPGGGMPSLGGGGPTDNSMIAPMVEKPQMRAEGIPPALLALLIAQSQGGRGTQDSNYDQPPISGGIA